MTEIRTALGDDARRPQYIRTVQRFGYAFIGSAVEHGREVLTPPALCWISWRGVRTPLKAGENVLGRDPSADVQIDAVGVSRRHAVIVVGGDDVILRDLSSKNGTFIADGAVTSAVALNDGAEIRLGPIPLTFHRMTAQTSTQTVPHRERNAP